VSPEALSTGERLAEVRQYLGIELAQAEAETGIPEVDLTAIETGQRPPGDLELARLARCYGHPTGYFLRPPDPLDPSAVSVLARLTDGLTDHDREEALRFAAYLRDASED
jgi:transcriptional regulator with XRE-family HTH domain